MADKTIGSLPAAPDLYDDSLLAVEQQGQAVKLTGAQIKGFARQGVSQYVQAAQDAASEAESSADRAFQAADNAAHSASQAADSALTAQQYSGKPPIILNGTWWTWNAAKQEYVDTGEAACGNVMYAVFFVNPADGALYMVVNSEYTGPQFRLNGADLEVVLSNGIRH